MREQWVPGSPFLPRILEPGYEATQWFETALWGNPKLELIDEPQLLIIPRGVSKHKSVPIVSEN